jgi:hypothetical protein
LREKSSVKYFSREQIRKVVKLVLALTREAMNNDRSIGSENERKGLGKRRQQASVRGVMDVEPERCGWNGFCGEGRIERRIVTSREERKDSGAPRAKRDCAGAIEVS